MTPGQRKIIEWYDDPVKQVVEEFRVEPDKWQAQALRKFPSQNPTELRMSLNACAGPGKTALLAWCGLNFISTHGGVGNHPKGACVSVTQDNLKDNLWPEFSKWMARSTYLTKAFEWTKERIYARDHPETWFLSARSWSKTANQDEQGRTLSGLHADDVLFLIDESGEIPITVLKAAEQALGSCKWGKIMQAGNPTSKEGMLYAAATNLRHQWDVTSITGDPDDPMRSPRVDIEWAREQIALYGRDDPWVMAYILGQFPPGSINTLLSVEEIDEAMKRVIDRREFEYAQKRLGIDVARGGLDKTSLFPRQGLQAYRPVNLRNAKGHDVAARAALAKQKWNWEVCYVDDTGGFGGAVCDAMLQANISFVPINFSGQSTDPRYFNKRSEMWFNMAEWVKRGGALPNMPTLRRELSTPTYTFQKGKFRLEEKDQIVKRLKYSPDDADALALTFAHAEMPSQNTPPLPGQRHGGLESEYDPLARWKHEVEDAGDLNLAIER